MSKQNRVFLPCIISERGLNKQLISASGDREVVDTHFMLHNDKIAFPDDYPTFVLAELKKCLSVY